jgi:hypothetical protein
MRARTAGGATNERDSSALRLVQYVQFWLHVMFVKTRSLRIGDERVARPAADPESAATVRLTNLRPAWAVEV